MSLLRKLLLLAAGLTSALAVGVVGATATPRQEVVTLSLMVPVENRPQWDAIVGNFERQFPNIKITTSYVPGTTFPSALLTQFQAGSAPDLFPVTAGAANLIGVYALGSQGKLLDLSGSPWVKRIYPAARKLVTVKQRIYGFPAAYNTTGVLYNMDVFRSLGVSPPKKFSDLIAICQKATAAGKVAISSALLNVQSQVNLALDPMVAFVYALDPNWTLERIQHKVTFAGSPLWQRMMAAIVQMRDAGCFSPNPAALSEVHTSVASGDAAMMLGSIGEYTTLLRFNPNGHFGMFPFPADNEANTSAVLTTGQLVLAANKATQHPEEARTFIDFVGRPKQDAFFATVAGSISGDNLRKGILPDYAQGMAPSFTAGKVVYGPNTSWPRPDKGLFSPGLTTHLVGLFTGQQTPQQILEYMDQLWDGP